jgi:hypothetical protein
LYKAIQTRDCGFLYLVRDDDSGYVLWKTDHAGDLLWQRSISFDGAIDYSTYHSPVDVVELPNGDLYVLGQRVRNAPIFALISVVALRLSAEGELIEQIEYPGIENFQALMALVADSGDVYLAGARIPSVIPSGSDYIMVVARLRGYGEPEWIVELEQGLPDYLAQAENGDLLVVGDTWSTLVDGVYIGQVASDGAVIREHRIAEAGAGRLNGFSLLSDGGYLLSMDESWFFKQYPTSRLVRLDGNGDVLWTRVAEFNAGFDVYGPSVAADDGGAVIGGTRGTFDRSDFQTDFFVEKVDTEGNTLWRRDYGGFAADLARFLIGTAEGGYLLAGESSSFDDACTVDSFGLDECEDLWALKLDADGNAPTEPEMQDTPGWVAGYWADPGLTDGALTVRTDGPGYVAAANSVYSPYDTCYLFAVDGTGVPEWVQPVTVAAGSPRLRRVIALEDGGYGVVGSVYKTINGLMVVRLAQDGSELWRYAPEATVSTEAYDLAETDDGGLIVVGSYYDASAEAGGRYAGYLVRLSANGDEVWRKWEPGAELARIVAIEPAPDGYDLLVNEKVDGVWRSRLVEVDRDGVVLDGHPIPHELGLELTDLLPIDTGGWILGGRTYTDTNWSDGVIVRMSAAGEVVWSVAPETYSSSEVSLAKLPDGNVLAAGRANYGMLLDVWTVEGEFVSRNTVAAADTNGGRGKLVVQEEGIAGIGRGNLPWGYGSRAVIFQADLHGITDREITHYELD